LLQQQQQQQEQEQQQQRKLLPFPNSSNQSSDNLPNNMLFHTDHFVLQFHNLQTIESPKKVRSNDDGSTTAVQKTSKLQQNPGAANLKDPQEQVVPSNLPSVYRGRRWMHPGPVLVTPELPGLLSIQAYHKDRPNFVLWESTYPQRIINFDPSTFFSIEFLCSSGWRSFSPQCHRQRFPDSGKR
jgi:hypothetical protein